MIEQVVQPTPPSMMAGQTAASPINGMFIGLVSKCGSWAV